MLQKNKTVRKANFLFSSYFRNITTIVADFRNVISEN